MILLCLLLFHASLVRRIDTTFPGVDSGTGRRNTLFLRRHLANVPSPAAEGLDHLGRDRGCQRDADEDEGFVDGVGEGKFGPEACLGVFFSESVKEGEE
jgi:hypothetical protein